MGKKLIDELIEHTQLPKAAMEKELQKILNKSKVPVNHMDIEDLRRAVAEYLQEVFIEAKEEFERDAEK